MAPVEGVTQLRADISKESTAEAIIEFFGGEKAQIVVSDGAPDSTGMHEFDCYVQSELIVSALSIAINVLETGGSFVAKIYRAEKISRIYTQLKRFFKDVCVFKPSASRNSSIEAFVVARQFRLPEGGHKPCNLTSEWHGQSESSWVMKLRGVPPIVHVPFVAYNGDLDSDRTYDLVKFYDPFCSLTITLYFIFQDENYVYREAVQQPLTAAYQEVLKKTGEVNLKYKPIKIVHDEELYKEWQEATSVGATWDD